MTTEKRSRHTPGPWYFVEEGRTDFGSNKGMPLTVADVKGRDDLANVYSRDDATVAVSREEAIANARLIAAAPDLLALAKKYASECSECDGEGRVLVTFNDREAEYDPCDACTDIRAVIEKAEGRE